MGTGHTYNCKCKSTYKSIHVGIGMMYPRICERTYVSALDGDYGESWKTIIESHPNGGFDCEKVVYKCSYCDYWEVDTKKSYYIPQRDYTLRGKYIMWIDKAFKRVKCIKTFRHICPCCSKTMHIANLENETLICQKCSTPIKIHFGTINWD